MASNRSQRKSVPMAPPLPKPSAAFDSNFSQTSNSASNRKKNDFGGVSRVRSTAPADSKVKLDSSDYLLRTKEPESKDLSGSGRKNEKDVPDSDHLLPGIGSITPHDSCPSSNAMDRLSYLPNEVVFLILSFLSIKQAIATSVLSKRWLHLWKLTGRVRIFSQDVNYNDRLIDSVLSCFKNPACHPLQELSIEDDKRMIECSSLRRRWKWVFAANIVRNSIHRWISFALDLHNVQVFSMCIYITCDDHFPRFPFYPALSSSCDHSYKLMHLKLACCEIQPEFEVFRNLRSISIFHSSVTDYALESINVNCTLLQRLELHNVPDLETLRVSSSLCHLKHLSIDNCDSSRGSPTLVIESPNLTSLDFRGSFFDPSQPHNLQAPRLKQLTLSFPSYVLSSVLTLVPDSGVENVDLGVDVYKFEKLDHSCLSLFSNVKELRLVGHDHSNLGPILSASSSLKRLKLSLLRRSRTNMESALSSLETSSSDGNWKHQNLEKIEISGFGWTPSHVQLLKCMVELAVGLKKIVIIPSKPSCRDNNGDGDEKAGEYVKDAENMLPQGAELVILPPSNDNDA